MLAQLPRALRIEGEQILLGDFNLHHPLWGGPQVLAAHAMADNLIDLVTRAGLTLDTPRGMTTRRRQGDRDSTLDLTFSSMWVSRRKVRCETERDFGGTSDHLPVALMINTTTRQAEAIKRPNWKEANWELVNETLQAGLTAPHWDRLETIEELEQTTGNRQSGKRYR
jgi:hypothetical protein